MITIGIGCGKDAANVILSAKQVASSDLRIQCYCLENTHFASDEYVTFSKSENPHEELINDLLSGKIDGAVRGTLPANETLRYLKKACGVSRLERIALLESAGGELFFLAPVGVDEGWSVEEKVALVHMGRKLAKSFGLSEKTCVLSGGRLGDIGRHPIVDKTIRDAEEVAKRTGAIHGEILIEDAVGDCGVIIAPDGISGNLIFRTLTFLGNGLGHGAPVVNIEPIFVDSSRASADYTSSLKLASRFVSEKQS